MSYEPNLSGAVAGSIPVTALALGPANTVLWSDGVANQWSANPQVTSVVATGFIGIGAANRSTTGLLRLSYAGEIKARNNANTADRNLVSYGVIGADSHEFGDILSGPTYLSSGQSVSIRLAGGALLWTTTALGNAIRSVNGYISLETAFLASARHVVALGHGAAITTTELPANTGDDVVFVSNATTNPTANSVGGPIFYASAGALIGRGTGGTVTTYAPA